MPRKTKAANEASWNLKGLLWLSTLVLATLALIAMLRLSLRAAPLLLEAAGVIGSMALSTVLWVLKDTPPSSLAKTLSHQVVRARWTRPAITLYVIIVATTMAVTVRHAMGCRFPGVTCLAVSGFDRDTTGSKFANEWLLTNAVLRKKMSVVFNKVDSAGAFADSACVSYCVIGSFHKVPNGWQLRATPVMYRAALLPPVQITHDTESPGAILALWHELADSVVARFGIRISAEQRNAMRAEPTTDSIALAKNNAAVVDAIEAQQAIPSDREKLDLAVSELRVALERDSGYSSAWANLGYVRNLLGERKQAIAAYETAIKKLPRHAPYYYHVGRLLLDSGDTAAAITALKQARDFSPREVQTLAQLAAVYVSLGNYGDAQEVVEDGFAVDSTFVPLLIERGRLEYGRGHYEAATRFLRRAAAQPVHNRGELELRIDAIVELAGVMKRQGRASSGCLVIDSVMPYVGVVPVNQATRLRLENAKRQLRCG